MIEVMEKNGGLSKPFDISVANRLNEGKFNHQHEANSFDQMFMNEVGGIVDFYKEDLAEMMEFMYEKETRNTLSNLERKQQRSETMRLMGNVIYNIFRLKKVGISMPTIYISSALHASVRWDKKQKFQDHDIHDFRHATAALPYCDYFFTEKRLAYLATQNQTGFDKLYGCEVQSRVTGAVSSLQNISITCDTRAGVAELFGVDVATLRRALGKE